MLSIKMKLHETDKRLLSYLYHHYREPLTKIAKACKLSREQVEYRLKKYETQGLIKKYLTIFNYYLLGYKEFIVVWLKLDTTKKNKDLIRRELENMKNVVSTGDVLGTYDLFVDFVFKTKQEFEEVFYSFLKKHDEIKEESIFMTTFAEFFPMKQFGKIYDEKTYTLLNESKPIKISEKDLKVLKILEENGRARVIDIASKTGLSSELVVYKLKQFYKNKLILGTRIQFDMEKLGFYFGTLIIKLRDKTEKTKNKIKSFCKYHKYINALSLGVAEYDCIIQIFYKKEKEFRQTIKEINEKFRNEIEKSFILLIENEGKVKTLPY